MSAHDLSCILHVHSTYSDGSATVPEILDEARAAGADCVLLTDHDTLQARRDGWEGWHDGVLLIVGEEISPRDGHLLAFGLEREIVDHGRGEVELCNEVRRAGGFGLAAHPFSEGSRMSRRIGRPHPWRALEHDACVGVELWSMATDTAESWRTPREAAVALRRPDRLDGPPERHLTQWDALCRRRRTVAVGGLDAHQPGMRIRGRVRSPMPHARWFGLLRTHVIVEEAQQPSIPAVLSALRAGHCYLALRQLGDPRGFAFDADWVPMGAEASWHRQTLHAVTPHPAELTLLRDGEPCARAAGGRLAHRTDTPGVYRVEARLDGRRWIVSNPIYLR